MTSIVKLYIGENMKYKLSAVEQWMVKSNLERVKTDGLEAVVNLLKQNGYIRVATAVRQIGEKNEH